MEDILWNVLLRCDLNTIKKMLILNKLSYNILHDKYFWREKFKYDRLYFNNDKLNYIQQYEITLKAVKNAKDILFINNLERNLKYRASNNDIVVFTNKFNLNKLDDILEFDNEENMCVVKCVFQYNNGIYNLRICKIDMSWTEVDLDYEETMIILSRLLVEDCQDQSGISYLFKDDSTKPTETNYKCLTRYCIRQGIWETLQ